jgi:hypothetical protein
VDIVKHLILLFSIVLILQGTSNACDPDFIESRNPMANSMQILVLLSLSSVQLAFYTTDSCIQAQVNTFLSESKTMQVQEVWSEPYSGYSGIWFFFLDEGLRRKDGVRYTVFNGLVRDKRKYGSDVNNVYYKDPDRQLERFLLSIASESEVVDTLNWHRPLTRFVPDSLITEMKIVTLSRPQPPYGYTAFSSTEPREIFDLNGRLISSPCRPLSCRKVIPSIFIMKSGNRVVKSICIP